MGYRFQTTFLPCGLVWVVSLCAVFPQTPSLGESEHVLSTTCNASHFPRRKSKLHVTYKTLVCPVTASPLPSPPPVLHHKSQRFLATGVCCILGRGSSTGPSSLPHSLLLLLLKSPLGNSPLCSFGSFSYPQVTFAPALCSPPSRTHFSPPGTLNILHCSYP